MTPIAEILYTGYSVLTQPKTHCKGMLERVDSDGNFRYCARGLLRFQEDYSYGEPELILVEAIFGRKPRCRHADAASLVVDWNNAPERTQAEVRDAFLLAASIAWKRKL